MPGVSAPMPQDVARALNRLTAEQFAQVCSETGFLEVTLPGSSQAAKAAALVERTQGRPDFIVLVRAINRVEPNVWRSTPALGAFSSLLYGIVAFVAILGLGGLMLVLVLSGGEQAAQVVPTPTSTLAPTRTPVPTIAHTPSPTLAPTDTPTPPPTATPTRAASQVVPTRPPSPTHTIPPPAVSIVYPMVEPRSPQSGYHAYPGDTVEFRWILGDAPIKSDERYLVRLYAGSSVVDTYLTSDPWRHYWVPPGATGEFAWTVTVVKVDAAGSVIGALSPESQPWAISWQP